MAEKERVSYRMGKIQSVLIVLFAILVDLLQALLTTIGVGVVINIIMNFGVYSVLWIWFMLNGISYFKLDVKRVKNWVNALSFILEEVPVSGALPWVTISVSVTLIDARIEDRTGHSTLAVVTQIEDLRTRKRARNKAAKTADGRTLSRQNRLKLEREQSQKAA